MKNFRENGLYTNDEFNKRNIKVYCFRVIPETGSSNFKRNIRFAQLFSIAFSQIVKLYEILDACVSCNIPTILF